MSVFQFEWDVAKDRANQKKHGISFEVASRVFLDPLYVSVEDRTGSGERRWQTIGSVGGLTLLFVAHLIAEKRENGELVELIRIISARFATRKERQRYENENG